MKKHLMFFSFVLTLVLYQTSYTETLVSSFSQLKTKTMALPVNPKHTAQLDDTFISLFSFNEIITTLYDASIIALNSMSDKQWIFSDEAKKRLSNNIKNQYFSESWFRYIVEKQINILEQQYIEAEIPLWEQFIIVDAYKKAIFLGGDLHGDIHAFVSMITPYINDDFTFKREYGDCLFITIGDYVDGPYSIELLTLIAKIKTKNNNQFFIQRGNHETIHLNKKHLVTEINKKFYDNAFQDIEKTLSLFYASMPLATWIGVKKATNTFFWYLITHAVPADIDEDQNITESFVHLHTQPCDTLFFKVYGNTDNKITLYTNEEPSHTFGTINQNTNYGIDISYLGKYYLPNYFDNTNPRYKTVQKLRNIMQKTSTMTDRITWVFGGHQHPSPSLKEIYNSHPKTHFEQQVHNELKNRYQSFQTQGLHITWTLNTNSSSNGTREFPEFVEAGGFVIFAPPSQTKTEYISHEFLLHEGKFTRNYEYNHKQTIYQENFFLH